MSYIIAGGARHPPGLGRLSRWAARIGSLERAASHHQGTLGQEGVRGGSLVISNLKQYNHSDSFPFDVYKTI